MKNTVFYLIIFSLISFTSALAQWRPLETTEESRQRHSAENWDTYEQHGRQAPLGGYPERLGDPAPPGTERPGFTSPSPGFNPPSSQSAPDFGPSRQQHRRYGP